MTMKDKIRHVVDQALEKEPWVNPGWEPFDKCSEDEKDSFVHWLNILAALCPKSLGAIAVSFENCSPERQFIMWSSDDDDPDFLTKKLGYPIPAGECINDT